MATIIKIKTSPNLGVPATAKIGELSYSYATGAYNTSNIYIIFAINNVSGVTTGRNVGYRLVGYNL